jgi:hypothetical protein
MLEKIYRHEINSFFGRSLQRMLGLVSNVRGSITDVFVLNFLEKVKSEAFKAFESAKVHWRGITGFFILVIFITDFWHVEENYRGMKKRARSLTEKDNAPERDNVRAAAIYDVEFFDTMLKQLDELRQWCESLESRLWWVEEAMRLSRSSVRMKLPQWYESWLTGKIDTWG